MSRRFRVVQLGLGPIGIEAARTVLDRPTLELTGAVDIDPALRGRPIAELPGLSGAPAGTMVDGDLASTLERLRPDAVLQTTGSRLDAVAGQIETICSAGANLVSTAEELLWPWRRNAEHARRIDALARDRGVSVLGTGVNPGFVMDTLAAALTVACRRIESVTIRRVVDAASRRGPLQKKVGAGLTADEFRARASRKELGHVGLVESLDLLSHALGGDEASTQSVAGELIVDERLEPVIATSAIRTEHVDVSEGSVAGIHHVASGQLNGREIIRLDLSMYVGAVDPVDEITIVGDPPVRNRIEGGLAGDAATVAVLVNCVPRVVDGPPGLLSMVDLAPPAGRF